MLGTGTPSKTFPECRCGLYPKDREERPVSTQVLQTNLPSKDSGQRTGTAGSQETLVGCDQVQNPSPATIWGPSNGINKKTDSQVWSRWGRSLGKKTETDLLQPSRAKFKEPQ